MKYGQLVANTSMNETIYRCFEYISKASKEDERRFVRKFREQRTNGWQMTDTFRELVLGAHLCSKGFRARYERAVESQTPDWAVLGKDQKIVGIVEVMSFHAPKAVEDEFEDFVDEVAKRQNPLSTDVWVHWPNAHWPNNSKRLYQRIQDKISKYKGLVEKHSLPFALAKFNQFPAEVLPAELKEWLLDKETGLFTDYPHLSGVLFFREGNGDHYLPYNFEYLKNPEPSIEFNLS